MHDDLMTENEVLPTRSQLRPRRPSPKVLMIRWAIVLTAGVLILTLLIGGGKSVIRALNSAPKQAAAASQPSQGPPPTCTDADIELRLAADGKTYSVGNLAIFTLTISHIGKKACTYDAGNIASELIITSGSDRIWSSSDCDTAGSVFLLMKPGNEESRQLNWSTNRSTPGCSTGLAVPRAGTYRAVLSSVGKTSEPVVFSLT